MLKLLSTKYKDWKYEDEVRIFADLTEQDPDTGMYFKEFDDNLRLREIILGARCESTWKDIDDQIREYTEEVSLIHARLAFRSFRIVENKAKRKGKV